MKRSIFSLCVVALALSACEDKAAPVSDSGVTKAHVDVPTGSDGLTTEQRNVRERLVEDNKPGSVKHLYVISAYSGQVILYSTVRGKVTSSGKRLSPTTVVVGASGEYRKPGFPGPGGTTTGEVLQDDGTYGSSDEYVFWWDSRGVYHQHYVAGGQIVHVSSAPLNVSSVTINVESRDGK